LQAASDKQVTDKYLEIRRPPHGSSILRRSPNNAITADEFIFTRRVPTNVTPRSVVVRGVPVPSNEGYAAAHGRFPPM
jgi:hypothetical protein